MNWLNWLRRYIERHSAHVLASDESLDVISRGVAVGMFFGFTPLFGLKTILSIIAAWMVRGSKLAAVLAVALHDLALPILPVILRAQYDLGSWLLSNPHRFPKRLEVEHLEPLQWLHWTTFLAIGKPLLVGSVVLGIPIAVVSYFVSHNLVRIHRKRLARARAAKHPDASMH